MALAPDGRTLATGGAADEPLLWDLATGKILRRFVGLRGGSSALALSPDGQTLAAGGNGWLVVLWDVATGDERIALGGNAGGAVVDRLLGRWPDAGGLPACPLRDALGPGPRAGALAGHCRGGPDRRPGARRPGLRPGSRGRDRLALVHGPTIPFGRAGRYPPDRGCRWRSPPTRPPW